MEQHRLTGPEAGVLKYDLLTALNLIALNGSATRQMSMIRLMTLVTARYNWRNDELTVGQRDMARMWATTERTVKREMKRLTDAEILICKRGGVRGRVGAYRLNYHQIADLSEPAWLSVGADFDDRMRDRYRKRTQKVVSLQSYSKTPQSEMEPERKGTWGLAMANLAKREPGLFDAWFARLQFLRLENGVLYLRAPSKFIQRYIETHLIKALIDAAEQELGPIDRVDLTGST